MALTERKTSPFHATKLYRILAGCFGLFLIGVGFYVLFFAHASNILRFVAGSALILFGCNKVVSAYTARESWLSKIGPLP